MVALLNASDDNDDDEIGESMTRTMFIASVSLLLLLLLLLFNRDSKLAEKAFETRLGISYYSRLFLPHNRLDSRTSIALFRCARMRSMGETTTPPPLLVDVSCV